MAEMQDGMREERAVDELQALDAIAAERDMVLAFRVCEGSDDLEPVFLSVFRANAGGEDEAALIAIEDDRGMSLGRYVVARGQLDHALDRAPSVDEDEPEPTLVPLDWEAA